MSNTDDREVFRQIKLLGKSKKSIISDLDVNDVIPDLLSKFVISHADKQRIDHEVS